MDYLVRPIAAILKWSFDTILVPLGELPTMINPNTLFTIIITLGLGYWLFLQQKFNKKAEREGGIK